MKIVQNDNLRLKEKTLETTLRINVVAISLVAAALVGVAAGQGPAPPPPPAITIEQAVVEAIGNNPGLLAERLGIPVAEATVITAGLRPNPLVSLSSDHLDLLGTG